MQRRKTVAVTIKVLTSIFDAAYILNECWDSSKIRKAREDDNCKNSRTRM